MAASLFIATLMVTLTVVIHFVGLIALTRLLEWRGHHLRAHESRWGQGLLLILVVLGLVAIHTVEIWVYAILYFTIGAVPDFESALYFSTVAFSSLGYGDIVLSHEWRLVSAIEAVNGLILIGWSTAFLLSLMGKLRALEHEWLERDRRS
jgi:hypothetical protein